MKTSLLPLLLLVLVGWERKTDKTCVPLWAT
jgi:hypothetical protein